MTNYAQIPTHLICRFGELTKREICVLTYLYTARNRQTGRCNPSRSAIGRAIRIAQPHVSAAVSGLKEKGWISEATGGNFNLAPEPTEYTETVGVSHTETVEEGIPIQSSDHTDSVAGVYQNGNSHIRISSEQKNEQKNEQSKNVVAVATVTDHSRLMHHHSKRIGTITDGGAQGKAIKTLLKNFSVQDCIGCYEFQVSEMTGKPHGWRSSVNWHSVLKFISEWITAGRQPEAVRKNGTFSSDRAERAVNKHNLRNELKARVESRNISGSGVAGSN